MEINVESAKARAVQLLNETRNCAYSSFVALAEALGIELDEKSKNMAIGFAGGISGSGHICGALWGSIAITSLYTMERLGDRSNIQNPLERYMPVYAKCAEVFKKFVEANGSPNCSDLNPNLDLISEEQRKKCMEIVSKAVEITLLALQDRKA